MKWNELDFWVVLSWLSIPTFLDFINENTAVLSFIMGLPLIIIRTIISVKEWRKGRK